MSDLICADYDYLSNNSINSIFSLIKNHTIADIPMVQLSNIILNKENFWKNVENVKNTVV